MKITPYQLIFRVPKPAKSEVQTSYGIPDIDTKIPVEILDGNYVIHTHDRRGSCSPGDFYQVVFEITDPYPFEKNELRLTIDSSAFRSSMFPVSNDLYYNKDYDLWYQRSRYTYNPATGKWRLEAENKKSKQTVDSITASGVFKINVLHNGNLLNGSDYDIPWIYVLPSSVSQKNYLHMISDLLELNDRLVRKDQSTVGIGNVSYVVEETSRLTDEIINTEKLIKAIKGVMHLPSELQGKRYVRTDINKVRHFDARVMQDYFRYGMSGTVSDIDYYENHDTYENRVIKYVLRRLSSRLEAEEPMEKLSDEEIKKEITRRLKERTGIMRSIGISPTDSVREEIEREVHQKEGYALAANELLKTRKELIYLLKDEWFTGIRDLPALNEIRLTPKFERNNYYSTIYEIFTERYLDKPYINASFDVNTFGVRPTQQIYEYWVFYKLLSSLIKIGFVLEDKDKITDHFSHFTRSQQLKPVILNLIRKDDKREVHLEFGYNITFRAEKVLNQEGPLVRTPDYYIRIFSNNRSHWYFLDAKYKDFRGKADSQGIWYVDELFDVAVSKYIKDLGLIFEFNTEYKSTSKDIRGSYIIMANIDEGKKELNENDRLFTVNEAIREKLDQECDVIDLPLYYKVGIDKKPRHKYGAIKLVPDDDQELTTLYQLIFEYLETNNNKEHPNFNWCWRCSSNVVEKESLNTLGTNPKYYTTCPDCGDFRVITNCSKSNGKHLIVKHETGNYHKSGSTDWDFFCPECGENLKNYYYV